MTQEEINKAADDAVVNKYPISGTLGLWKHGTAAQRVSAQRYNDGCIDGYKEGFKAGFALAQPEWVYCKDAMPEDDGNLVHIAFHWPDDPSKSFTNLARIDDGEWLDSEGDKFCANTKWVIYAWRGIETAMPPLPPTNNA